MRTGFEGENQWEDKGEGVFVMYCDKDIQEVTIGSEGMDTLACIHVPVIFFDPFEVKVEWANPTFEQAYGVDERFAMWLEDCQQALTSGSPSSAMKVMLEVMQDARASGRSIDLHVSKSTALPFAKTDLPQAWTLHCHAITLSRNSKNQELMTIQAPSLVEPPRDDYEGAQTATDSVIKLIDRAMENSFSEGPVLSDLRQRVLDGRMDEPMDMQQRDSMGGMDWDTSASLAMMMGIPFGRPTGIRKSIDYYKSIHAHTDTDSA